LVLSGAVKLPFWAEAGEGDSEGTEHRPSPEELKMNSPSHILHWSFIDITLANLIVIAIMVLIFGLALVLRFPHRGGNEPAAGYGEDLAASSAAPEPGDESMWTARVRTKATGVLAPKKLLPDRQPAYVASWIYTFGVASLVALGIVIGSGFALALGGSDWWHTNPVGHFFNSVHLWSVELFMALLVIHLWGKFWMAAWRGRRAMTWITGVIAFGASIVTAFTGYLSQQNFDSQWISTSAKDAFNSTGVGAFFNPMNFGQMFMWHIVLLPLLLVVIVGAHILLVRMRGVSHPLPVTRVRGRQARKAAAAADARPWRGPTRRYDILKEATAATLIVGALTLILAGLLSSPDIPAVTVQNWANHDQLGFVNTAAIELDGTSLTATYGQPYNNAPGAQQLGPISWQKLAGITQHINPARTFVIDPLTSLAKTTPALASALSAYTSASPAQQVKWASAYDKATAGTATKTPFNGGNLTLPAAGPVPVMMSYELAMAKSGALDTDLLAQRQFYGTDFTKPLLFLEDGAYYGDLATGQHLQASQWGVMNETGNYPGQPWLWLYQLWYQIPPGSTRWSGAADVWAVVATGICTMALLFVPFIPGLRDVPRFIPVHRLIWKNWNQSSHEPTDFSQADDEQISLAADVPAEHRS
jgi:hypothetical protein